MIVTWGGIVRLLRRRLVLGIIFGLSLTYCAISLLTHEKVGSSGERFGDDGDNLIVDNDDLIGDQEIDDEIGGKSIQWPPISASDDNNGDSNNNSMNVSEITRTCRNSIQGKALIVDERGLVCPRRDVLPGGCCRGDIEKTESTGETTVVKRERYSCDTCNPEGCCAVYEYCVSCCLHPAKRRPKKDSHGAPVRRDTQKSRRTEDAVKMRFRSLDRFQICLAICRTSSASVRHENTYKDPNSKYCYVNTGHQRNQRDLIMFNNNGDSVAVTSSTVRLFILVHPHPSFTMFPKKVRELYYILLNFFLLHLLNFFREEKFLLNFVILHGKVPTSKLFTFDNLMRKFEIVEKFFANMRKKYFYFITIFFFYCYYQILLTLHIFNPKCQPSKSTKVPIEQKTSGFTTRT